MLGLAELHGVNAETLCFISPTHIATETILPTLLPFSLPRQSRVIVCNLACRIAEGALLHDLSETWAHKICVRLLASAVWASNHLLPRIARRWRR